MAKAIRYEDKIGLILSKEEATVLYNLLYRGVIGSEEGPKKYLIGKGGVLHALRGVGTTEEAGIDITNLVSINGQVNKK